MHSTSMTHPFAFILSLVRHRHLVRRLAVRRVKAGYVGSVLGLAWAVINPLFMLAVYTFVFSVVLQIRWGVAVDNRGHFALFLFSGLLAFNILQWCLTQSPNVVVSNPSFVKKVVFPLEILPWVLLAEALFQAFFGSLVFLAMYLAIIGVPPATILMVPIVVLPLCLFCLGVMWFLSSAGVYLRDLTQLMGVVSLVLLFLCPIFYPLEAVPEKWTFVLMANPLTLIVTEIRTAVFHGAMPRWGLLGAAYVVGWASAYAGYAWFMLSKRGFSDVV